MRGKSFKDSQLCNSSIVVVLVGLDDKIYMYDAFAPFEFGYLGVVRNTNDVAEIQSTMYQYDHRKW